MEASITLKKVGKLIDDKTIVAGLTFGIEKGSLVAIIGANDTGKSILLRLLSGYEKPDYGNIFIHGNSLLWGASNIKVGENIRTKSYMMSSMHDGNNAPLL